jgi:hypothetical protein
MGWVVNLFAPYSKIISGAGLSFSIKFSDSNLPNNRTSGAL